MKLRIERLGMMGTVQCTMCSIFFCLNISHDVLFRLPGGQSLIE